MDKQIIDWFNKSFSKLFSCEQFIISSKVKEEAINHRLLHNLEIFCPQEYKSYHFDMEYDKIKMEPKSMKINGKNENVRPDIIIHIRGDNDNLVVFECKKYYLRKHDKCKLLNFSKVFNYKICMGISYMPDDKEYFRVYDIHNSFKRPIKIKKSNPDFEEII